MKAAEARKLIGKPVVWMDTYCAKRGYFQREGVLLAVNGRNVCIDQFGRPLTILLESINRKLVMRLYYMAIPSLPN